MSDLDGPVLFRYTEDAADEVAQKLGKRTPVRPTVAVRLSCETGQTNRLLALVDSGSERTFAAGALARAMNLDLNGVPEVIIGLGGDNRAVRFVNVTLQLFRDVLTDDETALVEWQADVGFLRTWEPSWAVLLGRDGFFDRFTVTMHGGVPAMVLEPWGAFDERFGVQIEEAEQRQPRFLSEQHSGFDSHPDVVGRGDHEPRACGGSRVGLVTVRVVRGARQEEVTDAYRGGRAHPVTMLRPGYWRWPRNRSAMVLYSATTWMSCTTCTPRPAGREPGPSTWTVAGPTRRRSPSVSSARLSPFCLQEMPKKSGPGAAHL